jgi:hypothetical protein
MIDKLYELVDRSKLTLIGYTYKDENAKDRFLLSLNPHKITSTDNIHSYIRNIKLDRLIDAHNDSRYLLLDISSIATNATSNINRANAIRHFCESLRAEAAKFDYRVIITAPLNRTMPNHNQDIYNFTGGITPMYSADLSFQFVDGNIKVVKNRFGPINI